MDARLPFIGLAALIALAPSSARAAEPYRIQTILPLTGPAAFLGKGEQISLRIAQKVVNDTGGIQGRPVEFVFHDDQTSPQVALQLTNEALVAKPAVILGSSLVAVCRAMGPVLETKGPVEYCFSPGIHPEAGSYVFTSSVSTLDLADALIHYFHAQGWKKLGLIFSTDATGQDAERGINAILAKPENGDMHVAVTVHFNTADVSVAAQIEQIKGSGAQAMIAWSTGTPIATIFRGIKQAGLDIPVATTDGNMTYEQMKQYKDFLPNQLYIPAAQWVVTNSALLAPDVAAAHQAFYKYFAAEGRKPDIASEVAWDAPMIVISGLRKLGPRATAAQLREYIATLKGYAGVNGVYDFTRTPQRGLDVSNAVVTRWQAQEGTWEVVSKPTNVSKR